MIAEAQLLQPTIRGLLRLGWCNQMSPAGMEVRWREKRLDLVVVRGAHTIAVELKVDDWRRAVRQAYLNRWAVHESFVGIWHSRLTCKAWDHAHEAGVGILIVTPRTVYPLAASSESPPTADFEDVLELVRSEAMRVRDLLRNSVTL